MFDRIRFRISRLTQFVIEMRDDDMITSLSKDFHEAQTIRAA